MQRRALLALAMITAFAAAPVFAAAGAITVGLIYGDGTLVMKNAKHRG